MLFTGMVFDLPKANAATPSDYDYSIIKQSPYPNSLKPGETFEVSLEIKNTGSQVWKKNGNNIVRLGTGSSYGNQSQQRDYDSEFYSSNWLSKNRPVNIDKESIYPGQSAIFGFTIKAPEKNGTFKAYFTPVVDGYKWMKDRGIYWQITVGEEQGTYINNNQNDDGVFNNYASSVVKITCDFNEYYSNQGSGTLFKNTSNNPNLPPIYVLTNLHVIKTENNTESFCEIKLFPNPKEDNYLKYQSIGYRTIDDTFDFAIIEPKEIESEKEKYKIEELYKYALPDSDIIKISPQENLRDRNIYVIGYPSNGNLTLSKGGFLGYENYKKALYINTDAEVKKGNSGGLAIDSSGEMVGIPTFLKGNIGMILDIDQIFKKIIS